MTAHYSPSAYQPARIPDQPAAVKRSWLFRFGSSRLPLGHTEEIVPHSMLSQPSPAGLRDVERHEHALATGAKKRQAYELLDYHQIIDHERYRHAPLSKRSLFWFYLWGGGALFFRLWRFYPQLSGRGYLGFLMANSRPTYGCSPKKQHGI
ncbi:hypothetical protein [Stutzerimonas nitrititolerans]|uniref:hypothetical protein n=1 Tax=Stutzerimonas nitrititolerans TaxID=2482751 RepID=UPI003AA95B55